MKGMDRNEEKSIKGYVRDYIYKRTEQVQENPDLAETGRETLSTIFYYIRPLLLKAGVKISKSTRRTIQVDYVKEVCEKRGYTRAQLGIIAAVRAQLYFRGKTYNIDIDSIDELIHKGTDVLIIEKEGL